MGFLPQPQSSDAWVFRPESYGAKRDGLTDDTAAIRACIAAAVAWATGTGTYFAAVRFSPGIYAVSGPLVQGGATNGNAQIPLPIIDPTGQKLTLMLLGFCPVTAFPHWQQAVTQATGAVLKTTLTGQAYSATHGLPSVVGGPTPEHGYGTTGAVFSNLLLVVDGVMIEAPAPPTLCGWDLRGLAAVKLPDIACQANQHPSAPTLANNFMAGLLMPVNGNNDLAELGRYSCEGWHRGIVLGEHTNALSIGCVLCHVGIGISGPNGHGIRVGYASVESCPIAVQYVDISPVAWGGNGTTVMIDMLDTEDGTGDFAPQYLIDDPADKLHGIINVTPDGGFASTVLNSAAKVRLVRLDTP